MQRAQATFLWMQLQVSNEGLQKDQLYWCAITIANLFPGYELGSDVHRLRIKQTIIDVEIQAALMRMGEHAQHEQTMGVHTSTN